MRRFVTHLLIFTVLASNVVWAVDDCFSAYASEASVLAQPGDLSGDSQSDNICEEFCLGWLHLVTITFNAKFDYPPFVRQYVAWRDLSYHSPDQKPPIRPPQI